jgi:ubiquinone/menaquinone biosynthesis C-methylase UbiE
MADWISFFDSDHAIYVNARHRDVHARVTGGGILQYVRTGDAVLDYGCGEAAYAETIAKTAGKLILCEAAPKMRDTIARRIAGHGNISVLTPEQAAALPEASIDSIVMHSVSQYLSPAQCDELFRLFRRLLRKDGRLVVGDVVQPGTPAYGDALDLLRFGAREGFFLAAIGGLIRTLFSGYSRLRKDAGLSRYDENSMLTKLAAAGFSATRQPSNIGHLQTRMAFVARPTRGGV